MGRSPPVHQLVFKTVRAVQAAVVAGPRELKEIVVVEGSTRIHVKFSTSYETPREASNGNFVHHHLANPGVPTVLTAIPSVDIGHAPVGASRRTDAVARSSRKRRPKSKQQVMKSERRLANLKILHCWQRYSARKELTKLRAQAAGPAPPVVKDFEPPKLQPVSSSAPPIVVAKDTTVQHSNPRGSECSGASTPSVRSSVPTSIPDPRSPFVGPRPPPPSPQSQRTPDSPSLQSQQAPPPPGFPPTNHPPLRLRPQVHSDSSLVGRKPPQS